MPRHDFALTPEQRADARSALAILAGSSLTLTAAAEIALHRKRPARSITVSECVSLFLASRISANARPSTVSWYEDRLTPFAVQHGSALVNDLRRAGLMEWVSSRSTGARPGYLRAIRAMIRWAASQEPPMATLDSCAGMRLPAVRRDRDIAFLSVQQCAAILRSGKHRAAFALALFAGIRPDEIAGKGKPWLRWDAINETERIIRIPAESSKTRSARTIEGLPPAVWAWLATVSDRDGSISSARSRQFADSARSTLGLRRWVPDVMRHTFATYATAYTEDAAKVSLWLGHEGKPQMLHRHYRGLTTKAQAEAFFALRP